MKIQNIVGTFIVLAVFALIPSLGFAQITSDGKVSSIKYSDGSQDNIYVFCGQKGDMNASLTASSIDESATFEWLKYDNLSREFKIYPGGSSGVTISTISNLQDGCYRVNITTTSGVKTTSTAWVFNNYIESTAEITESNCTSFLLKGTFNSPPLTYVDLPTGQDKILDKEIVYKWLDGSPLMNRTIFDPPTKDTDYTFQVSDRFGCNSEAVVTYLSIVTKARFGIILEDQKKSHPSKIEAPLTITFSNLSENGDPGKFKWFIIKKINALRDSVIEVIINDTPPFYTFKETGIYKLKLVSKHDDCTDSISEFELGGKIQTEILIDASFIEAPNFFTPDGDDSKMNEEFVIRFFSMKSVKISIFNRWGKVLHVYENNNVQGFGPTKESAPEAIWDGKVGGKLATPGVYYYVVEGIGRDDRRQRTNGFFHLFRGK